MIAQTASLRLVTAPTREPLDLLSVKAHLRVDGTDEDDLIFALLLAATQYVEERCWIALMTQTWRLGLETWPPEPLRLPKTPLLTSPTIAAVRYQDSSGSQHTLDATVYTVQATGEWGLAYGQTWPSDVRPWSIEVEYTVGYGATPAALPAPLGAALKLLIGHLYENREAVVAGAGVSTMILPLALDSLLSLYEVR